MMSKQEMEQELTKLILKSLPSQLADIEPLSQHCPAAGARLKKSFLENWRRRLRKAGYLPKR